MIKLLIVDDNISRSNKLTEAILLTNESKYIEVKHCDTADKARELCKSNRFDVLILDVCLPKKDGYTPAKEEGLKLLKDLSSRSKFLTPTKIIGITANIEFIHNFRNEFMSYTSIVYEAVPNSNKWIDDIINNLTNVTDSKLVDQLSCDDSIVISLHGIRTHGHWQNQMSEYIQEKTNNISYHSFKYGYYSIFFFIFPFIRYLTAMLLIRDIKKLIEDNTDKKIYIVAHSYGTYVISKLIESNEFDKKIDTLFFCGSVLPSSYNISNKLLPKVNRVVNDCGTNDIVLIVNKIFVPLLGDAGRKGFDGVNNDTMCNRYFTGGHSLYFETIDETESFIEKHWIPYILDNKKIKVIDERKKTTFLSDFIEPILSILSISMSFFYLYFIYYLITL